MRISLKHLLATTLVVGAFWGCFWIPYPNCDAGVLEHISWKALLCWMPFSITILWKTKPEYRAGVGQALLCTGAILIILPGWHPLNLRENMFCPSPISTYLKALIHACGLNVLGAGVILLAIDRMGTLVPEWFNG